MPPIIIGSAIAALLAVLAALKQYRAAPVVAESILIAPGVAMPLLSNGITKDHGVWLALGGRGIDTAFLYGDDQQRQVGEAIASSGIPRDEIFLTTKVNCCPTLRCGSFCKDPPFPNDAGEFAVQNATEMLEHSLAMLRQPYADLVLLHFPCADFRDTLASWEQLEAAKARGWARAIGVSNFNASLLKRLLRASKTKPAVVQNAFSVAGHPPAHRGAAAFCREGDPLYGSDDETLAFCRRKKIAFSAYSPLGHISKVNVLHQPKLLGVAAAHGKSAAQVALRWLVQQRIAAVTASSSPKHILEALGVWDFALTKREARVLDALI